MELLGTILLGRKSAAASQLVLDDLRASLAEKRQQEHADERRLWHYHCARMTETRTSLVVLPPEDKLYSGAIAVRTVRWPGRRKHYLP
jgi:hypothetical protein